MDLINSLWFTFHFNLVYAFNLPPPLIILNHSQIHSLCYLIKTICQTGDFRRKPIRPFVNLVASGVQTTANFHPCKYTCSTQYLPSSKYLNNGTTPLVLILGMLVAFISLPRANINNALANFVSVPVATLGLASVFSLFASVTATFSFTSSTESDCMSREERWRFLKFDKDFILFVLGSV